MATGTEKTVSGRTVRSLQIADVPLSESSAPWSPPVLAPRQAAQPLDMRLGQKKEVADRTRRVAAYAPEPGMVLVQAGEFVMGDDEGSRDEHPQHKVLLNSYWIDKYPVTNADYKAFTDATGHRTPAHWGDGIYPAEKADHPVTNVSWNDAMAYATWAGKRLPTEAEWEKAARGTMGQVYSWGDAFRKDNVNSSNDYGGTTSVDAFSGGVSPYGVMDMCGNVMEWCADWYYDDYYKTAPADNPTGPQGGQYRVVRGGFYGENKVGVRCAARHFAPPSTMQDHGGFRCAKTPTVSGQNPAETRPAPKPAREAQPAPPKPVSKAPISPNESVEQIAARWPENVAKLIRSLLTQQGDPKDESADLSAHRKVAVLMVGLGSDLSAEILKYLSDPEIEMIARPIAELGSVTVGQKDEVFDEVKGRLVSGDYPLRGDIDFARATLEKALGPRKAQALLDRVTGAVSSGFYLLQHFDPAQIVSFIAKEHPQTIAMILSQLDPRQAAGVLNGLPEEQQSEVSHRIATMDNITPQALRRLEESLAADLQALLSGQITEVGGPKAVAEILNRTGRSTEKAVLQYLDAEAPDLAEKVRNQMFVFDDIARLTDREIQVMLREVDTKDLAVALKGGSEELQGRIFPNLSEEAGKEVREEMEFSGPVRMSDVEDVQLRIVQTVRQLEEQGQVTIVRGDSRDVFV